MKTSLSRMWKEFKKFANKAGYTEKVVGDYAFRSRNRKGLIRLTAINQDTLTVYEEGIGSYRVPLLQKYTKGGNL